MDVSLSKFRICALPQRPRLNVSWHPNLPIIRLLGVDMTVDHLPKFLSFWTSRYRLVNQLELVKKLESVLLESHRFMKLLSIINHRWKTGTLPNGTTGGRILYRRRLDDARDQGQKLWRFLLQLLQHSQALALEQSGNKETEGWIDAGVEREFEGEIFFSIFYDDYLFGPPTEGYDIERLLLGFECWNDNCKTWINAADALSRKALCEPDMGYFNLCPRLQGQHTLPVTQTTQPQNSSGLSQVDVSEQTAGDVSPVSPLTSPCLPSAERATGDMSPMMGSSTPRPSPHSGPPLPTMRRTARPRQNSFDFNQVAPPGQGIHAVPLLRPVPISRLASARRAARTQRLRRIPPRSGYFTPRPGRLGRLIQPIPQQRRTSVRTTYTNQNSFGINQVARPREEPTIVVPSLRPTPSPYSPSTAAGAGGDTAPPRTAPTIVAPSLRPKSSPYWPSDAGWASGEAAPTRPAPTTFALSPCWPSAAGGPSGEAAPPRLAPATVTPLLRPAPSPCSPSPAEGPSRKDDAPGKRSPPRERLNRLMREQFGVDLALPPEERVFPEHIFITVNGVRTLRPEKFPCLFATAEGSGGEIAAPRPAPTIVALSLRPGLITRSPSAAGEARGEVVPPEQVPSRQTLPRPAPTIAAPPLAPTQIPRSSSPSGRVGGEDGALGTRSRFGGRLNNKRLISERIGLDLPHEERVYPEHIILPIDNNSVNRRSIPGGSPQRHVMPARDRVRNGILISMPISEERMITIPNGHPVELASAVDVVDLDTDIEQ